MVTTTETQTFVYATYIRTTPEKLWAALTQGEFSRQYWMGNRIELEERVGGRVRILPSEGGKAIWNVSGGWPQILSNLKSLLETGQVAFKSKPAKSKRHR